MSSSNETNRNNSLKSTGPRTEQGKRRSSQNAIKHGIFAKDVMITGEDSEQFRAHKAAMIRRLNPRDVLEMHLVDQIIADTWTIQRMRAAEQELYADAREDVCRLEANWPEECGKKRATSSWRKTPAALLARLLDYDKMERLDRYQRRLSNSIHRCLKELRELRKEKDDANEPLTDLAHAALGDLVTDDEDAIAQNEAIPDANVGVKERCDAAPSSQIDHSDDSSSLEKRIERQMTEENDPAAIPKAA